MLIHDFRLTKSGEEYTAAADRMCDLILYSAPDLLEFDYERFQDPNNILPEWLTLVQASPVVLKGSVAPKGGKGKYRKNMVLQFASLAPAQGVEPMAAPAQYEPQGVGPSRKVAMEILTDLMNHVAVSEHKSAAFSDGLKLTPEGKEVAKTYFAKVSGQFSTKKMGKFTLEDIGLALRVLLENAPGEFISDYKDRVDKLFAVTVAAEEENDIDVDEDAIPF